MASHHFYVSFQVADDYRVSAAGRHIGDVSLNASMKLEGYLILAGKRWKIIQVDDDRKTVVVEPSPGGRPPHFEPGQASPIHRKIQEMMRDVLAREDVPSYLDEQAKQMLSMARSAAREAGLFHKVFIVDGVDLLWFPWAGTRIQTTLMALGKLGGRLKVAVDGPALRFEKHTEAEVRAAFQAINADFPPSERIAADLVGTDSEKYEPYLSMPLRNQITLARSLDIPGAKAEILKLSMEVSV